MGSAWMLVAGLCFALMSVVVKSLGHAFSGAELVFYRSLFAILAIAATLAAQQGAAGVRNLLGEHIGLNLRRGVVGFIALATFFYALIELPMSVAVTLNYASPLWLALLMPWQLGERPGAIKWIGILIAFAGVGLIAAREQFTGSLLPVVLVMGGAFFWALGQVLVRGLKGMTGLSVTAWTAVLATPQLFLLSALFETGQIEAIRTASPTAWGAALYLGLVMTTLGYFLWNSLILRKEVGQVAPFLLLLPVFSVVGGVVFLGEALSVSRLAGGAVVLSGVALITLPWPQTTRWRPWGIAGKSAKDNRECEG